MVGWVTVMTEPDYENWLANGGAEGTMGQQGERLFGQYGCSTCHQLEGQGRGPNLRGVYGSRISLADGRSAIVDDAFIRESILNPNAHIVAGYKPDVMPSYTGQISEEGLLQLIVYIKSLAPARVPGAAQQLLAPPANPARTQ